MLTETEVRAIKPVRYLRKIFDGGGLHILVKPNGRRCWRYAYCFDQKHKTLALGIYPEVPLTRARSRHEFARNLLAHGLDPSVVKVALGKHLFVVTMREWEEAQDRASRFHRRNDKRRLAGEARTNLFESARRQDVSGDNMRECTLPAARPRTRPRYL